MVFQRKFSAICVVWLVTAGCTSLVVGTAPAQDEAISRLRAAITDLQSSFGDEYPGGAEYLTRLAKLERRLASSDERSKVEIRREIDKLAGEALLANPLLHRHPIVFVVRHQYANDHHNTATIFQTDEINTHKFQGPGAIKLLDLSHGGRVETLLEVPDGVARDLEVSFDGQRILFSMRHDIEDDYHLYEMNADGTGLRQLTDGRGVADIDPVYLPDGSIVFTSTREPKYCMCNRHIMGNLFRMDGDGGGVHQIGRSTLFEGHTSLLPDGRLLYDRWEYVDRNFGDAQGLWSCRPDGTQHVLYWGNHTKSPGAVLDARVLPDGQRILCVFSSCHDRPWGALALVDRRLGLEGKRPVVRTWPPSARDLVMVGNYDTFKKVAPKYEDPFPLSDKYFLCSRQTGSGEEMGIYLVDVFGNETLVYRESPGCYDPMPLASRVRPPALPDAPLTEQPTGRFYVHNVYEGFGMERVPRGAIKYLRVVESPEKRFWTPEAWKGAGAQAPGMNWHDFNNKRILGTVEVADDGSAYVEVPANRFVYFQVLDERGMMIQSMRSGTMVRPGEMQSCVGCHEPGLAAPPVAVNRPLPPAPQSLDGWLGAPRRFNYLDEVQPVFDRYCVSCHDYGKPAGESVNLAGDVTLIFNTSYIELWRKKMINAIGGGPAETQPPYAWGSHQSRLIQVLDEGHYDVQLDPVSRDRLVTWIDINAPYYPSYASAYPNHLYGRSPLDKKELAELSALTGRDLQKQPFAADVNFTRPELSSCLADLRQRRSGDYEQALAIIRRGAARLEKQPRPDMPGFRLVGPDAERQRKYEMLMQ